jgi:predicted O-methyltransferase YrrM
MTPRLGRVIGRSLFNALLKRKTTIAGEMIWVHVRGGKMEVLLDNLKIGSQNRLVTYGDPVAIALVRDALKRANKRHPELDTIEEYRLSQGDGVVHRNPYGGEYEQPVPVSDDRAYISIPRLQGQFLYELVRTFSSPLCLELGTAYGVSGLYTLAGSGSGRLITIEADRFRRDLAVGAFERFGMDGRVTSVVGYFSEQLPDVLAGIADPIQFVFEDGPHFPEVTQNVFETVIDQVAPGGILVFDDIYHKTGNEAAWRKIAADDRIIAVAEVNGRQGVCVKR